MTDIHADEGESAVDNDGSPAETGTRVTGTDTTDSRLDDAESLAPEYRPFYEGLFKGVAIYRCPYCGRTARDRETRKGGEQIATHVVRFHRPKVKPTVTQRAEAIGLVLGKGTK